MSPQRQILLVAGVLAIVAFVLGSIYFVFLRQPDSVLFANLRPMDAASIVAELDKKKIPYHLTDGGKTILVAADKVDATRLSILSEDLPLKGAVGFELFNKSDIGLTEFAQKINYQRALQGELARTIMALDAVDSARVHLSLPEPTIFEDDKRPPKASIALTLKPGKQLSSGDVLGIQRLVAAAVVDLDVANVVVVDGEGQVISSDTPAEAPATPEPPHQHEAEAYYAGKIRNALATAYPGQTFTVKVTATPPLEPVPTSAGTDGSTVISDDPFLDWTPENRKFPLRVNITGAAAQQVQAMQNIRVAVAATIGDDPDLGDDIIVTSPDVVEADPVDNPTAPAAGAGSQNSVVASASSAVVDTTTGKFPWLVFWIAVLVVAMLGLTFAGGQLLRANRPPRKLTDAERRDIANRFQAFLERGDGDEANLS